MLQQFEVIQESYVALRARGSSKKLDLETREA